MSGGADRRQAGCAEQVGPTPGGRSGVGPPRLS